MRCRTYWIMLLGLGITLACAAPSTGQIKLFRKAQPEEGLELTQSQGPWLIMCASFVGEPGEQQARRLAEELRSDYNLDAYLYRHSFNYSDKIQALGWDPPSDQTGLPVPKQLKAAHADKFEEIAVVVGNFPSLTDSNAQKNLELVKHLQPAHWRSRSTSAPASEWVFCGKFIAVSAVTPKLTKRDPWVRRS